MSAAPLSDRPIRCNVPSLPTSTQGSVVRSKSPLLPAAAPPQRDIGCSRRVQVLPPSLDTALTSARAAPSLQRSCCHAASSSSGLPGARASIGSTSASTYEVPVAAPPPVHPAATGVAVLTRLAGRDSGGSAVASPPPPPPPQPASAVSAASMRARSSGRVPLTRPGRAGQPAFVAVPGAQILRVPPCHL